MGMRVIQPLKPVLNTSWTNMCSSGLNLESPEGYWITRSIMRVRIAEPIPRVKARSAEVICLGPGVPASLRPDGTHGKLWAMDEPTKSLAQDLVSEMEQIPTIDAHEHLPTEESYVASEADFYSLFEHYCQADLVSAGATDRDLQYWSDRSEPAARRWTTFRTYLDAIRTGSYARSALHVVRDILEVPDLTDATYLLVGEKLAAMRRRGLYDFILRDRCNIEACIQCWHLGEPGPDYFYHLAPGPELVDVKSMGRIRELSAEYDVPVHTLDDLLAAMTLAVERWRGNDRVVGIKSAHAYSRSIAFRKVDRCTAERVFNSILTNEGHALSDHEVLPLQDFLMFALVARAEAVGLPMVFHTGLQAGNLNRIANANPLLLQPILEEFPRAKIDLFHAGMPFVREIAVLAKYFPGVHLNLAWSHIISPAMARAALSEWIDLVPNTKIFGFGGDYAVVEKVYGHLKLARENIARVLAEKIQEGSLSRSDAAVLARRFLRENPARFYGIVIAS